MLSDKQIKLLKGCVSNNLRELMEAMDWTQARLAEKMGCAEGTISHYVKGERLPPLDFMVGLCALPEIRERGFELNVDALIGDKFNPTAPTRRQSIPSGVTAREAGHGDFLGNYLCYFFDQSKPLTDPDFDRGGELRYGVVSVHDVWESLTGERSIRAKVAFFKEEDGEASLRLKRALDAVFQSETDIMARNAAIEEAFRGEPTVANATYGGTVAFSDYHVFLNVYSDVYDDNALMIFYSPQRRGDTEYAGGLGTASLVARGRSPMPTAQRVFMTKYELNCPCEVISEALWMAKACSTVSQEGDANALCDFCRKLYQDEVLSRNFAESDKKVLVRNRLDQIVAQNVEKNIRFLGGVSEDEDRAACRLIEQYRKQ